MKHAIKQFAQDEAGMVSLTFVTTVSVILLISVFLVQFAGISMFAFLDGLAGVLGNVPLAL